VSCSFLDESIPSNVAALSEVGGFAVQIDGLHKVVANAGAM
jgi:hypothetical protein